MSGFFSGVLPYVGLGFAGMLIVGAPLLYFGIWAAEKYLTKQNDKHGKK